MQQKAVDPAKHLSSDKQDDKDVHINGYELYAGKERNFKHYIDRWLVC